MEYVVSACLIGTRCRYDGTAALHTIAHSLWLSGRALPLCPEVLGGLRTPRLPCEICHGRVVTQKGQDMTAYFWRGAALAVAQARQHGCTKALLKSRSPSCGARYVYDGSFSGKIVSGQGLWAQMLTQAGISVYDSEDVSRLCVTD